MTPPTIVLAEDDVEDRELTHYALNTASAQASVHDVSDGLALLAHLRKTFAAGEVMPGLILLDLRMPGQDGFTTLSSIRADRRLAKLPVVILSNSADPLEIDRCYGLGANSFVSKPATLAAFVGAMGTLVQYWFDVVDLPPAVT